MLIQGMMAVAMLLQGAQATPMTPEPIAMVETQDDPAVLINLGVQLANAGEHDAARAAFEKVRAMRSDAETSPRPEGWRDGPCGAPAIDALRQSGVIVTPAD